MTSTPTAYPRLCIKCSSEILDNSDAEIADLLEPKPRQPDTSAERDERLSALQSKCEAYEKTLEIYARPDEAFPWRGVIARETLAAHKRGGGLG